MIIAILFLLFLLLIPLVLFRKKTNTINTANKDYKVIIIINKDLKMTHGKIISQACHSISEVVLNTPKEVLNKWINKGQPKIVVKSDYDEIKSIVSQCKKRGIPYFSIRDAGRTQIKPGSNTVIALGPEDKKILDEVTGHLKLY